MSDQEDDNDKPFEATAKKLQDAREKGEIPRSTDLMTAAGYGGLLLAIMATGAHMVDTVGTALRVMLEQADSLAAPFLDDGRQSMAAGLMSQVAFGLTPLFVVPSIVVILAIIAMQGFTFTGSKLQPKISRISLVSNFKNKFGRNGLFEFAKSFGKLIIISAVLAVFLRVQMPHMLASIQLEPGSVSLLLSQLTLKFLAVVLAVALLVGGIDFLWQRAEHLRKHRMSHKEMTDETKQAEGDPHMKQKRRQKGYDIATNRMLADVPTADVIIVNPEHYAVALKWGRSRGSAPVCVAKGVDEIAARMREIAADSDIPIHRDPPTARALHATIDVGEEISRDHYQAVAAAIRFADELRKKKRGMS